MFVYNELPARDGGWRRSKIWPGLKLVELFGNGVGTKRG